MRVSVLEGHLNLLDAYDRDVLRHFHVTLDELLDPDDPTRCQGFIEQAVAFGAHAVRLPSVRDREAGTNYIVEHFAAKQHLEVTAVRFGILQSV